MRARRDGTWLRRGIGAAVCGAALVQIALGLTGLLLALMGAGWEPPTAVTDLQRGFMVAAFTALGGYLILAAQRDARIEDLGALFLLVAVSFAHPPIEIVATALDAPFGRWVHFAAALALDALIPAVAWLFTRDFPRALELPRTARAVRLVVALSFAVAVLLIVANLLIAVSGTPHGASLLALVDRSDRGSHYWTLVFGLVVPTIPFVLWRVKHAPRDERRRVRLFAAGLAGFSAVPVLFAIGPAVSPRLERFVQGEWAGDFLVPVNLAMILGIGATAAYAILVRRVLEVRKLLRVAAQYWLARSLIGLAVASPFGVLAGWAFAAREQSIASIFEGERFFAFAALGLLGLVLLRLRTEVTRSIDRIFFREPYDAGALLSELTEAARSAPSVRALGESVAAILQRGLQVESVGMLVETMDEDAFVPVTRGVRRLEKSSPIIRLLGREAKPVGVDLLRPHAHLRGLSDADLSWLADADAQVLVPLLGREGAVAGLVTLGPKRSELPISPEDRAMLSALAGTLGVALENRLLRESAPGRDGRGAALEAPAAECGACGLLDEPGTERCGECDAPMGAAALPRELLGKFQLERRIGHGAMGVVYRARDVLLGRDVALKTLPSVSAEESVRLRREARAMAAIMHPHLALIHGVESWRSAPVLVIELLERGTLAERLEGAALGPRAGLELVLQIAGAVECIHAAGILHRDIKPRNIGFDANQLPKLLDFGLARAVNAAAAEQLASAHGEETLAVGTPLFMPPEAFGNARPEPGFDLWSLAVVAYESVTGRHPFARGPASFEAIRAGWQPALAQALADCPAPVVDWFAHGLARSRRDRPSTAGEFREGVARALSSLA